MVRLGLICGAWFGVMLATPVAQAASDSYAPPPPGFTVMSAPARAPAAATTAGTSPGGSGGTNRLPVSGVSIVPAPAAPPGQAGVGSGSGSGSEQSDLEALRRVQQRVAQQYQQWNNQASSPGAGFSPTVAGPGAAPAFAQLDQAAPQMQALMKQPLFGALLKAGQSPVVQQETLALLNSPNRGKWIYIQLGIVLFIFLLRAQQNARAETWQQRAWVRIYTLAIFWGLSFFVVPTLLFGGSFHRLVGELFTIFRG
jgi:hypothetical protein